MNINEEEINTTWGLIEKLTRIQIPVGDEMSSKSRPWSSQMMVVYLLWSAAS